MNDNRTKKYPAKLSGLISRREFIKSAAGATTMMILAACAPEVPPSASEAPATAAIDPTVAAPSSQTGGTLVVGQFAEPVGLNPITRLGDPVGDQVRGNIYNSLVTWDAKQRKVLPALATEWTQKDETTWVFKLREGVQFHGGYGEFTAEDVEFNVNYTVENKKGRVNLYSFVKGAAAIDKYTVEYYLEKPFAPFLVTTTAGTAGLMVSKKAYDEMGEEEFNRHPIGTGPFEFVSWTSGESIEFKKFEQYYKEGLPKLDRLIFRPFEDPFVRLSALQTGEIHFMDNPDYKDVEALRAENTIQVFETPGWAWDWLVFNMDTAKPHNAAVQNKAVRQAISYAIDREALAKIAYQGFATPVDNPYPPGFITYTKDLLRYPKNADLDKARELLESAGYGDGFELSIITVEKAVNRRELEILTDQLDKVGITVKPEPLDGATWVQRTLRDHEMEAGLRFVNLESPDPDSATYFFWHSGGVASVGYSNPTVDELLDQSRTSQSEAERIETFNKLTEIMLEDVHMLYLVRPTLVRVANAKIQGYEPSNSEIEVLFEGVSIS